MDKERAYIDVVDSVITISTNESVLHQEDAIALKEIIKGIKNGLEIFSNNYLIIDDDIFGDYSGVDIFLITIYLTKKAIQSIPKTVQIFETTLQQDNLSDLNIKVLTIHDIKTRFFELPESIASVSIHLESGDNQDLTIYCTDSLREVKVYEGARRIELVNCNNLESLQMFEVEKYVYGDFMNYLSNLSVYDSNVPLNYLDKFRNLKSYDGYIDKSVLKHLGGVRQLSSKEDVHINIRDIPNVVTKFNARIVDKEGEYIHSDKILQLRPNIEETWLVGEDVLDRYPAVRFVYDNEEEVSGVNEAIEQHNKKLVDLLTLS